MRVAVVFGTRPEVIKLAPIIKELRRRAGVQVTVVAAAQQRELLSQALEVFGIEPDRDLNLMQPRQTLAEITCRALPAIEAVLLQDRPDVVLVQGDTTTVFVASLAAFYVRIPVAHVEAGLRSQHNYDPFPEEINRRLTTVLASLHFAPTPLARDHLLKEGVAEDRIFVTGNPIVDALLEIMASRRFRDLQAPLELSPGHRLILVTLHRRESWGEALAAMCQALRSIVSIHPDVEVAFPVHLNPAVRETVTTQLAGAERITLLEPMDYLSFLALVQASTLVLTDSGGVQEEAPVLGKPVLVLRETTERPEAIMAGVATLVGTRPEDIIAATATLLHDPMAYERMSRVVSPFGDGRAAPRIVDIMLSGVPPPPARPDASPSKSWSRATDGFEAF